MNRTRPRATFSALVISLAILALLPGVAAAGGAPPYLVKNIRSGSRGSNPSDLVEIGNRLYFTASDGKHGREPWVSDGTSAGTRLIKNISPGSYSSNARDYTLVGSRVFFTAQDGNGRELWITDGTAIGTARVKDIRPGDKASAPASLTALGDILYFSANDGPHGRELWKSDGTAAGTVMVKDVEPGKQGSSPTELTTFASRLYFVVPVPEPLAMSPCCGLYRSDGTSEGTGRVLDKDGSGIALASDLTLSGSLLYFAANTPGDNFHGSHLWRTNGTSAGTKSISGDISPSQLTDVAGTLFFTRDDITPSALWKSDGTKAGTNLIKPVSNPSQLTASGRFLFYMTLNEDVTQTLRVSDGTARAEDGWNAVRWDRGYARGNLTDVAGTPFMTFGGNADPENQMGWDLLYIDCSLDDGDCTQYSWTRRAMPLRDDQSTLYAIHALTAVGTSLYFVAADVDGLAGSELWKYTPLRAETVP